MSARIQQKTLQNGELAYKQRLEEQIFDHFFGGEIFILEQRWREGGDGVGPGLQGQLGGFAAGRFTSTICLFEIIILE